MKAQPKDPLMIVYYQMKLMQLNSRDSVKK
jgi:hypothetical protein